MKLTKKQIKAHEEACKLLEKDKLTFEDKIYVLDNWQEGANNVNSVAGAFFTPWKLARDFKLAVYSDKRVIDLCAGIGALSLFMVEHAKWEQKVPEIVCLELNHSYIEVGKKIVPEATWIHGSVLDPELINSLGHFTQAISNPPFGSIKTGSEYKKFLKYKGSQFELKVIEIASQIADFGSFIIPQMSTPYKYSGNNGMYEMKGDEMPQKVKTFIDQTKLEYDFNCGIDTEQYINEWKGVSPMCEIVTFDFTQTKKAIQQTLF